MPIGIRNWDRYQQMPLGRASNPREEQDAVLAEMAHMIAAAQRPPMPDTEADWMMPGAREQLAAASNRPAQIKPGMAAPGRVPMQLSPEEEAAIDAEAGIGPRMALRDPLNPRAGGLPIGIMRSQQPMGSPEDMAMAEAMAAEVNAQHPDGIANFNPMEQYASTAGQQANRQKQLRADPKYQAMLAANQAAAAQMTNGNATQQDLFGSLRTPAMQIGSTTSRSPAEMAMMKEKNDAYKSRMAADQQRRQAGLDQKLAQRSMSPQQRSRLAMANQVGDLDEASPMKIGAITGDPRSAQFALENRKVRATEGNLAANRSLRERELAQQASEGAAERTNRLEVEAARGKNDLAASQATFQEKVTIDQIERLRLLMESGMSREEALRQIASEQPSSMPAGPAGGVAGTPVATTSTAAATGQPQGSIGIAPGQGAVEKGALLGKFNQKIKDAQDVDDVLDIYNMEPYLSDPAFAEYIPTIQGKFDKDQLDDALRPGFWNSANPWGDDVNMSHLRRLRQMLGIEADTGTEWWDLMGHYHNLTGPGTYLDPHSKHYVEGGR